MRSLNTTDSKHKSPVDKNILQLKLTQMRIIKYGWLIEFMTTISTYLTTLDTVYEGMEL